MAEVTRSVRHRINVSRTATGKNTWDCTVEYETVGELGYIEPDRDRYVTMVLSDKLVAELDKRYPCELKDK